MIVIGVIGSPAGGKSTVARRLRELGATWINADKIAHRCLDRAIVRDKMVQRFGPQILGNAGKIDRRALGGIVFGDDAEQRSALNYLESTVHPMARHLTLTRLTRAGRCGLIAAVLDAPLLLEADWGVMCDEVWCVDAPIELRATWIGTRGWNLDELRRRESRQLPISEKRRLSTHVIENDSNRDTLLQRTDRLWGELMAANAKPSEYLQSLRSLRSKKLSQSDESTHCLNYLSKSPPTL